MTLATFAGYYDARHPPADADRARVAEAVMPGAPNATTVLAGPLVVAATASAVVDSHDVCVLDGTLFGPVEPRRITDALNGDAGLAALRGEFALLCFDAESDQGLLAHDHLGCRALYWHSSGTRLTFGNDIAAVVALLDRRPGPDLATMAHLLGMSGTPVERSFYEGVSRLPAAHGLRFGRHGQRLRRYWSPEYRAPEARSRREHVDGLRAVIASAVDRRCEAGHTGVLLSGGLDSSSVAALSTLVEDGRRPRRTYSATFPDHPTIDERDLIVLTSEALQLPSTRAVVRSGSLIAGAIDYLLRWSTPTPSPNLFFWMPLLRRAGEDGTSVLLDGEAGDEIFGLSPYLIADRVRAGRLRSAAQLVRDIPGGGRHLTRQQIWPWIRDFGVKGLVPYGLHRRVHEHRHPLAPSWLRPLTRRALLDTDVGSDWRAIDGPRWWAFYVDTITRGRGPAMTFDHVGRRARMAGVEARHPFADPDVVSYVLTIPPELHYDPRYSRPLLREAVAGILPDEVRVRPAKSFFDALFHAELAGADLPTARRLLDPRDALVGEYVDLAAIQREVLEDVPGPADRSTWAQHLWRLVNGECWLRSAAGQDPRALLQPRPPDDVTIE